MLKKFPFLTKNTNGQKIFLPSADDQRGIDGVFMGCPAGQGTFTLFRENKGKMLFEGKTGVNTKPEYPGSFDRSLNDEWDGRSNLTV